MHDSQCFETLLDRRNSLSTVYSDSAYRSEDNERLLKRQGWVSCVHHRVWANQTLTKQQQRQNRARSRIRIRVRIRARPMPRSSR